MGPQSPPLLAAVMAPLGRPELFIGGKWVAPSAGGALDVICPATEAVVGCVGAATAADVDAAVAAARAAFPGWRRTSGAGRAAVLRRIAAGVRERKSELATLEARDCGKPIDEAEWDMDDVATCYEYYADKAEALDTGASVDVALPDDRFACRVIKEPLGVVALITPWNYPLLMATWKVAPALAAGCAAVLKPSENASLTCQVLADIAAAAGVPPGVLNVLTGLGPDAGAPLVAHPGVDKVAFTGSLATGKRVMRSAADRVCPVTMELGGKSPVVVFDDAATPEALQKTVEWIMFGIFWTNGQICSATSRLLVQRGCAPALLAALKHHAEAIKVCDPLQRDCRLGPVVSAPQYAKINAMLADAKAAGAAFLTGGARPAGLDKGFYLAPTVVTGVTRDMTIWKEEVFGPVLCVMEFDTEEEGVALANESDYGLGAAVITADSARAARMTDAFDCGLVWVNCSQPCFCHGPWGGCKRSGFGRELGEHGMDGYMNTKQVTTWKDPAAQFNWYPSFAAAK